MKEQFTQAVEERAREVISGKKVGKVPESINGYYGKNLPNLHTTGKQDIDKICSENIYTLIHTGMYESYSVRSYTGDL